MVLDKCLFIRLKNRNNKYIIEHREWLNYQYVTIKVGGVYYLTRQLIDNPHWSEWREFWNGNNPIKCRKLINENNKKWAGLKQYRLK
jgi:hypothetical protein